MHLPDDRNPFTMLWVGGLRLLGIEHKYRCAQFVLTRYTLVALIVYLRWSESLSGVLGTLLFWLWLPASIYFIWKPTEFVIRGCFDCCRCRKPKHRRDKSSIELSEPHQHICMECERNREVIARQIEAAKRKLESHHHDLPARHSPPVLPTEPVELAEPPLSFKEPPPPPKSRWSPPDTALDKVSARLKEKHGTTAHPSRA